MMQLYVAGHATWLKLGTTREGRRSPVDIVSPSKLEARVGAAGLAVKEQTALSSVPSSKVAATSTLQFRSWTYPRVRSASSSGCSGRRPPAACVTARRGVEPLGFRGGRFSTLERWRKGSRHRGRQQVCREQERSGV